MITYGYTVKEHDDSYVDLVETAVHQFSECLEPGAFLVDVVPARKSRSLRQPIVEGADFIFLSLASTPHP